LIETITTSIFYLKIKENNENDMVAHAICFLLPAPAEPNSAEQRTEVRFASLLSGGFTTMAVEIHRKRN
jgi:hypothetical protein